MAEELTLRTQKTASLFNKDMLLGGLIGASIPILGVGLAAAVPISLGLAAAGAIVGGISGKIRQEKENAFGKPVGKPSFWNKETAIGALLGYNAIDLILVAGGLTTLAGTAGALALSETLALGALAVGGLATVAAAVAAPFIGAYLGGKSGEKRMSQEYAEARQQEFVRDRMREPSQEMQRGAEPELQPGQEKQHLKEVQERRLLAAAQQNVDKTTAHTR